MFVIKRNGSKEPVQFNKITNRISKLCDGLDTNFIDPVRLAQKVIGGLYEGVTTVELDNLAAETAANLIIIHPDYAKLAARIAISNLQKQTDSLFSTVIEKLYRANIICESVYRIVAENAYRLDSAIDDDRDFQYNYFGFKTLEKSYLLRIDQQIVERPQHLLMRVAVGIHREDIDAAIETYLLLSEKQFIHASPTLFFAGTKRPQLSSCFLLTVQRDSIEGIYDTLKQTAQILKYAGGIGINVHDIRANGTRTSNGQGTSNGLVPMLKVFNETAKFVNQGGNKRPGAIAIYLEPWHRDIFDFLNLKKNTGKEERRARDLFYALWIPDLFMKRVENDLDWTLMCPKQCPGLSDIWGSDFDQLYEKYERMASSSHTIRTVKARQLWKAIVESQIETGTPYILYKDACNSKSNQQNLGTIKSSNLCAEIIQYSSPREIAVCNLASIALNSCCVVVSSTETFEKSYGTFEKSYETFEKTYTFDFHRLHNIVKVITKNLNKVIDLTFYPVPEARVSNQKHRPIGIGVQGLADVFLLMRYSFDSEEARRLNFEIFETIYYAALETSCELAQRYGRYESYGGSPASRGILQLDMYSSPLPFNLRLDWNGLREKISKFGLRNSLLVAVMPTATTAQILGNNESIEPCTNNIYTRRVLSGEFQIVNRYLVKDLIKLNLWDDQLKNEIVKNYGSIQNITSIPDRIKTLYKTTWEISQKCIIRMAADRAFFIDQSQSLNIHFAQPNYEKLASMHFYAWKSELKTGMYYLRTRPASNPNQFTIVNTRQNNNNECNMCSS